jgi:hypothetical protein
MGATILPASSAETRGNGAGSAGNGMKDVVVGGAVGVMATDRQQGRRS